MANLLRKPDRAEWVALAVCALLAALFIHDWDGFVFMQTVHDFLHGVTPYQTALDTPWYSLLGPLDREPQWYAYPPLPLLLMSATFWPSDLWNLPPFADRLLLKIPVIVAHLMLARLIGAWVEELGGDGRKAEKMALWNPFLILVGPIWGMTDGLLMALLLAALLAVRRQQWGAAGAWWACALMVKPFPAFLAIPLLAWLLPRHGWMAALGMARTGIAVSLALCLPFLLAEPRGFIRQVGGAHLGRGAQGMSLWRWPMLDQFEPTTVLWLSMAALAAGLALASLWAARRDGPAGPIEAVLAGALAVLITNRVVNEQYTVMVIVPIAVLAGIQASWERPYRWMTRLMTAAVVLVGFHFLTFIPPDEALLVYRRPVDEIAYLLRYGPLDHVWGWIARFFLLAIPTALVLLAVRLRPVRLGGLKAAAPSLVLCLLLAGTSLAAHPDDAVAPPEFKPAFAETRVAAFYYLWWNNPGHDPDVRYGNWMKVSQDPAIGFYTNNRGIAAVHAQQMVQNGIDTAIVSYHRGELPRYEVFQEEAARAGLQVAPLIELNQVYDKVVDGRRVHRPMDENGKEAPYAAYRLSEGSKHEIIQFVLDLQHQLAEPNAAKVDGRPVVLFYDSYVSGVSFDGEDRDRLAKAVVEMFPIEDLRVLYNDTDLQPDYIDMLRYHPTTYNDFFVGRRSAPWRAAQLEVHRQFWNDIREEVETTLGRKLFWISGDAFNDRAGFEAGTVQNLNDLDIFDGAFIYSPSFTWGTSDTKEFASTFRAWEDRNHWLEAFANSKGRLSVVGLAPAYDDTVNRPVHGFKIPDTFDNVSTYERSWDSVLAAAPGWAAIATWNEFFEGSSIEPDTVHGNTWANQTALYREQLIGPTPRPGAVAYLMSERESRLSWTGSERDQPHEWGTALVAAGVRALAHDMPYAMDFHEATLAPMPRPAWILADGARGGHSLGETVADQVTTWLDDGSRLMVFGRETAQGLAGYIPESCRAVDGFGSVTLEPGDRLRATGSGLILDRAGKVQAIGATCSAQIYYVGMKPYGTGNSVLDAECLAVALAAASGGTGECNVPAAVPA